MNTLNKDSGSSLSQLALVRANGSTTGTVTTAFSGEVTQISLVESTFSSSELVTLRAGSEPSILIARGGVLAFPGEGAGSGYRIIAPESVSLVPAGFSAAGIATQGTLRWRVLSWQSSAVPILDRYLASWIASRSQKSSLATMARTCLPCDLLTAVERAGDQTGLSDFCLLACVLNVVPPLTLATNRVMVAPTVLDLPEQMQTLVNEVREDPSLSWSLTEASNRAGYSSFHFSRMFKQLVGCGFHEFVDRCRTEVAVAQFADPGADAAVIWSRAGFPSVRAMRESIRDYLGLTVSDLRRLAAFPT